MSPKQLRISRQMLMKSNFCPLHDNKVVAAIDKLLEM